MFQVRKMMILFACVALFGATACKKADPPAPAKNRAPAASRPSAQGTPTSRPKPAPAPRKPSDGIHAEEVTYKAGDTELKGYLAYDETKKEKRPGVLVVHEWWGHNDYARKRARMLAKLGYVAFALDMYGAGKNAAHPKDATAFMMSVMKNIKVGEQRFKAAKAVLEKNAMTDPQKIAAIGYCFGGAIVLHMARTGLNLAGVVSFHGNLDAKIKVKRGQIKAELLVLHGKADPFIKPKSIKAFKREMKRAKAKFKFIEYKDAKHAFTNPDATAMGAKFNLPLAYQKEADTASWEEMKSFFGRIFGAE